MRFPLEQLVETLHSVFLKQHFELQLYQRTISGKKKLKQLESSGIKWNERGMTIPGNNLKNQMKFW